MQIHDGASFYCSVPCRLAEASVVADFELVGLAFAQGQRTRRWLVFTAALGTKMVRSSDMK
jgi:hypothetical protein